MSAIRLVLGMVAIENLHIEQLDVKTTFFHGDLEEDLYMIQLEGFIVQGQENLVCKLRNSLYALNKLLDSGSDIEKINNLKKPDIAHVVGVVSRFMSRPGKQHWEAVKWILRYLKGSLDTCLCFIGASLKLHGYVDVDFAGDIDSRKTTIGIVFALGGTVISWASNLQKIVTCLLQKLSMLPATEAGNEMIWLYGFLDELGKKQKMDILHNESHSAIFLTKNSAFHSKLKHIQTKYHFICYLVEDKLVILEKICGSKNPTDMLTKGVTIEKLKLCATSIGLLT
ncbi:Retrovirus-related Pol polyprotein from transposon TNT 1-94 [Vitis vinifera]|uniref:Retrovirus-related Pol polyprotein from transposon TNT 1-94 n=1 Tax=Vitis vinifera TaxID=29760 RepID=A0A438HQQ8_VITVI|nr:Retrovirus-related Pol polyprotein from transposon TNT 1-94 [Vitis vinifera]